MRVWIGASVLLAAVCVATRLPAAPDEQGAPPAAQDNAKMERDLRDLENQRAKLDARIRDLRRKMGRQGDGTFVIPRIERLRNGDSMPEVRVEIERALEQARKAQGEALKGQEEALKALKDQKFVMPDVQKITGDALRLYLDADGKARSAPMSPEERERFRKQMDEMRQQLRSQMGQLRNLQPGAGNLLERRNGADPALRSEVEEMRKELDRLRDEVRGLRGKDNAPNPKLETYNLL